MTQRNTSLLVTPCLPWTLRETRAYGVFPDVDITVVITLFNYTNYITACLDSVVASILFDRSLAVEIVVVDDASTDSSRESVHRWMLAHDDQRVVLIHKQSNTGLPDARNLGIRMSRSEAIFVLDADNSIEPSCLSTLYAALGESSCSAAYPVIKKYDSDTGEALGFASDRPFDLEELVRSNYIDAMAMFKKSALLDVGLYDVDMIYGWEDYDLWLSLGFAGHAILSMPLPLANYRVHGDSMLQRLNERVVDVARYLLAKHGARLPGADLPDKVFGIQKAVLFEADQA